MAVVVNTLILEITNLFLHFIDGVLEDSIMNVELLMSAILLPVSSTSNINRTTFIILFSNTLSRKG